ncbi:hypothetical protein MUP01_11400 [Candidatus Bathyarchaeota archaeon]|nr:hypothetical protein [Candidatus Bathyarchaeota archaeon]
MKTPKFFIAFILLLACSLAATLATYSFYTTSWYENCTKTLRRGWPLYWITEWIPFCDYISHPSGAAFNTKSFLVDVVFWLTIFQLPSLLFTYLRKARTTNVQAKTSTLMRCQPSSCTNLFYENNLKLPEGA